MCDLCVFVEMLKEDARKLRNRDPFNWKEFWITVLILVILAAAGYGAYEWLIK